MKVAILFDNLGPYHRARLRAAAEVMTVLAVETSDQSADYAWERSLPAAGFSTVTLFSHRAARGSPISEVRRRLGQALSSFRPDAVAIPGWSSRVAFLALSWCLWNKVPAIAMSESTAEDRRRRAWVEALKRRIASLYGAALVGGSRHVGYARALGFRPASISIGYDVVDNAYFECSAVRRRHNPRPSHVPSRSFFIAAARFIPEKNLPRLLHAYAAYRRLAGSAAWDLVLLGDGPLRSALAELIATLQLVDAVHMPGFVQYDALPDYYAWAGALIHGSTSEPWGLVVNEAMASGLPVIVSRACGCAHDLVEDARSGFVFDPLDVDALAAAMARMASDQCDRRAMAGAGREIIGRWGPQAFASGLKRAAVAALESPHPTATLLDRSLLRILSAV